MSTNQPNLCPNCGKALKSLGLSWCGKKRMTLYACRTKEGCGRYTFYPVHEFQHTLLANTPPEATRKTPI